MAGSFEEFAQRTGIAQAPATVAGPSGLAQTVGDEFADFAARTGIQAQAPKPLDLTGTLRQWYTGRNLAGTQAGWDTQFQQQFQQRSQKAYEENRLYDYFSDDDAVGVVFWDGAKDSKGRNLVFGDVVVDGERQANVYEDFDRHTANLLMGEYTLDGAMKQRLNSSRDIESAWESEIDKVRKSNTDMMEVAPRAAEFERNVAARADEENVAAITAAGAGGGAALGAGAGAVVGGVLGGVFGLGAGAAPGAALGAWVGGALGTVLGGTGAYLNQDALSYQLARSREIMDLATKEGADAAVTSWLEQAGAAMYSVALSPFGNLVAGVYDATGEQGYGNPQDGGEFYEVDDEGQRTAPGLVQALHASTMVADSMLQFVSPLGRAAYTTQIGLHIAGKAGGMLPGVGQFDERRLEFDSVWTDRETGRFDLANSLAGIGNVGIDAVQLGAVRGLMGVATREAQRTGRGARAAVQRPPTRLEQVGLTDPQKAAIAAGGRMETMAGRRYVFDQAGNLVDGGRATLAMLAPSEALQSLGASALARRAAARRNGAVEAEDLYNAAANMATGQTKWTSTLLNAFGEAQEEVIQQMLEPISHDHAMSGEDIVRAGIGGFAAGLGMGAANAVVAPSRADRMYSMASMAHMLQFDGAPLSRSEFDAMTPVQQRRLVRSLDPVTQSVVQGAYDKVAKDNLESVNAGVVGAVRVNDAARKLQGEALRADPTDDSLEIVQIDEASHRGDVLATSHTRLLRGQTQRSAGIEAQAEAVRADIETLTRQADAATDPEEKVRLTERVAALTDQYAQLAELHAASERVRVHIAQAVEEIDAAYAVDDVATAERLLLRLNSTLMSWYDMDDDTATFTQADGSTRTVRLSESAQLLLAKAVSRVPTRHPEDSTGSWHVFVPQADLGLSGRGGRGDNVFAVSQIVLGSIRGDFDGDRVQTLEQLMLDDAAYLAFRSGSNLLGATVVPEVKESDYDAWVAGKLKMAYRSTEADPVTGRTPVKDLYTTFVANVDADLRALYDQAQGGIVPTGIIDRVVAAVAEAARNGKDVRTTLLTQMSDLAGPYLTRIGRGEVRAKHGEKLSNQLIWVAGIASRHMQDFQRAYAALVPRVADARPDQTAVLPTRYDATVQERRARRGATWAATLATMLPGSNAFRMFQKVHYTLFTSKDKYVGWSDDREAYQEVVQFYAQLARDATDADFADVPANDDIVARTLVMLREFSLRPEVMAQVGRGITPGHSVALVANMQVPEVVMQTDTDTGRTGMYNTGRYVSLAQQLLYLSLQEYRASKATVWETDEKVRAVYASLLPLTRPPTQGSDGSTLANAEAAFVHVFNSVRLYDILGIDSQVLGSQLTVGQKYREIMDMQPQRRREAKAALKLDGLMLGSEDHTVPYTSETVEQGKVTVLRTVVDSIFSAASNEISVNTRGPEVGKVTGRKAAQAARRSRQFHDSHAAVRTLLQRLLPKKSYTAQEVADLADQYSEFGAALLDTIPASALPWVVHGRNPDGTPQFASWFYKVWAEPNAERAEVRFLTEVALSSWFAKAASLDLDDAHQDSSEAHKIKFHSLSSRLHQLMFALATSNNPDSVAYQRFVEQMKSASSVDELEKWINRQPGLVQDRAPYLLWVDDVADFAMDKTGSGWKQTFSVPTTIEALAVLQKRAEGMVKGMDDDAAMNAQDTDLAIALDRVLRSKTDPSVEVDAHEEDLYNLFVQAVERARTQQYSLGPRAMLTNVTSMLFGLYAPAHAKGENPEWLAASQAYEVLQGAFGYKVNFERLFDDLHSHNEEDVASNGALVMRDAGRMMTDGGREASWSAQTADELIPLMLDPTKRHVLRSFLWPQVVELDMDNRARRKLLMGRSFRSLLENTAYSDLFPDEGRPGLTNAMKYLSLVESQSRTADQAFSIQQKVFEIAQAKTTSATRPLSISDIEQIVTETYIQFADVLMTIGKIQPSPGEPDPVHLAFEAITDALKARALEEHLGFTSPSKQVVASLIPWLENQISDRYQPTITSLTDQARQATDPATEASLLDQAQALKDRMDYELSRLGRLASPDILADIESRYGYSAEMTDDVKEAQKVALVGYVDRFRERMEGAGPATQAVLAIRGWLSESQSYRDANPIDFSDDVWEKLSAVVVSVDFQHLLNVGHPADPAPPYPGSIDPGSSKFDKSKFFDFTWSFLVDFMDPKSTDNLVLTARKLARDAGRILPEGNSTTIVNKVLSTIFREGTIGTWTATVPIHNNEAYELSTGAAAQHVIPMAGHLSRRHASTIFAATRTYGTPSDVSAVTLEWGNLNWAENADPTLGPQDRWHDVTVTHPNGQTYSRPFQQLNNRFASAITLTFPGAAGPIDLMTDAVARKWPGSVGVSALSSDLRVVSMRRLRDEVLNQVRAVVNPRNLDHLEADVLKALRGVKVQMEFVHPDTQEVRPENYNNLWHEGTVYESEGDTSFSLLALLFFGIGGINPTVQQAALDTRKKGLLGLEPYLRPDSAAVADIESGWRDDFAYMLTQKTNRIMSTPIMGGKVLDPSFYNAVYKLVKMYNWVEGRDKTTGEWVRWTAEQVIEAQLADPDPANFPLEDARLWVPSNKVLSTMLGDIAGNAVPSRMIDTNGLETDAHSVPLFTGWTDQMSGMFPPSPAPAVSLVDTAISKTARISDLQTSLAFTPSEQTRLQQARESFRVSRDRALDERMRARGKVAFDPAATMQNFRDFVQRGVSRADVSITMPPRYRWLEAMPTSVLVDIVTDLDAYIADQQAATGQNTAGWVYQDAGTADPQQGYLTKTSLGGTLKTAPGDPVAIEVDSFNHYDPEQRLDEAMKIVDVFAQRNMAIMFVSASGRNSLTHVLQARTRERYGYDRYRDNPHILVPEVLGKARYQNVVSATSRLVETGGVTVSRQRTTLIVPDLPVTESTIWIPFEKGRSRLDHIQTSVTLLPLDVSHRFNTPNTVEDVADVVGKVRFINANPEALATLRDAANVDITNKKKRVKADTEFNEAWRRLVSRLDTMELHRTSLPTQGEEFGTGDFIPLISTNGQILFYRHGYEYPYETFDSQVMHRLSGESKGMDVAVYTKKEVGATTVRGTVVGIAPSGNRGSRIELDIPIDQIGQKIVYEYNGMKYLQTTLPRNMRVPGVSLMRNVPLDGIASLHDPVAKEAFYGLVNSFQNAFTFFGIDFLPDLVKFFNGTKTEDQVKQFLADVAAFPTKLEVEEVFRIQSLMANADSYSDALARVLPVFNEHGLLADFTDALLEDSFEAYVMRATVMYLMTPGAQVSHVLSSSGFDHDRPEMTDAKSRVMPALFTRAFDLATPGGAVKKELEDRFNRRLSGTANEGWSINVDSWEVVGVVDGGPRLVGMLQFGEPHAASANPERNRQAQERKTFQNASVHQAMLTAIGTGAQARVPIEKAKKARALVEGVKPEVRDRKNIWNLLTNVDRSTTGPGTTWQQMTPAERVAEAESIARMVAYRREIDFSDSRFDATRTTIETLIGDVLRATGLDDSQAEIVHYWVRQLLWAPGPLPGQTDFQDSFNPTDVVDVLRHIVKNVSDGLLPTYDGMGPALLSEADLSLLFHAHRKRGGTTWAPRAVVSDPSSAADADSYGQWIAIAFSQALDPAVKIDPAVAPDLDGFMNTYRSVLRNEGYRLDVTLDKQLQGKLLDPKTNHLITVTTDPLKREALINRVLLPSDATSIDDLERGISKAEDSINRDAPSSWRARNEKSTRRWRAKNKIRPRARTSNKNHLESGIEILEKQGDVHSLRRMVLALRHGMAMLNPGLYVAMLPEQGFRALLSETTNIIMGTSTSGTAGALAARVNAQIGPLSLSGSIYTPRQVEQLNKLYTNLGNDGAFVASLIGDMMYEQPAPAEGRILRGVERFARLGNRWQDPTFGMTQKALARRYMDAVLRSIEATPLRSGLTVDLVIANMHADPQYIEKHYKDIHDMAVNAVADFRGLMQTPLSRLIRWTYEGMSNHANPLVGFAGTLLKLPLMYSTYNANVLQTMAGLQGYNQILSTFLDGRDRPGTLVHRLAAKMRGEEIDPELDKRFDMGSTLDGVTIANAFVKGGVTQTGLFMLGMISANGLGLAGEDEEARRRRRLAQAQGMPLLRDPRALQNDFRNKDMVFLDAMPTWMQSFFKLTPGEDGESRSGFQMSWIFKPFLNPLIGMERFFATGDFGWITHAYADALFSMPLFNAGTWNDAVQSAQELEQLAAEQQAIGTPTSTKNTMYLLTNAVGVYERILFENMFVNSLYTGYDPYDRDPNKLVLRDSDGDIQRTIENLPRQNDYSLEEYVDPETGEVKEAYMTRDQGMRPVASVAENNLVFALAATLFTGNQQGLLRYQMPVKLQKINMPDVGSDDAKLLAATAMNALWAQEPDNQRRLSLSEITSAIKAQALSTQNWDVYNNLDAIAQAAYESSDNPVYNPLSTLGMDGTEVPTRAGIDAVIRGLQGGTISVDDPSVRRFGVSREVKEEIIKDFYADAIQEGIDMELTHSLAVSRAKRLLYGPIEDPTIKGFQDIVYSLPDEYTGTYKQLNTTYVTGPDGYPWATGFKRGGRLVETALGLPKRPTWTDSTALGADARMNVVDYASGIDTGLRGVVPMHETEKIPTDVEQTQSLIDALKDIEAKTYTPFEPYSSDRGSGRYYRRGGGFGGGGYGGGGYSPNIYFSRMYSLPRGTNVYSNTVKAIFWDNVNIRRSTIRRERYQSSRGRLNQWQ